MYLRRGAGGLFFLLRVGGRASLKWTDVSLLIGHDGDSVLRIEQTRSKTEQYNEGHAEALKETYRPMCPVEAFSRGVASQPHHQDDSPVAERAMRRKLLNLLNWTPPTSIYTIRGLWRIRPGPEGIFDVLRGRRCGDNQTPGALGFNRVPQLSLAR